ncbi:hypothetical protein BDW62DRAFT_205716 [Aspergillus aurantiobrunneus]
MAPEPGSLAPLAPAPSGIQPASSRSAHLRADREPPRRRKLTSACVACRAARTKCSKQQPCAFCTEKNIECVVDLEDDHRRKIPLKRRLDSLEDDQELFQPSLSEIKVYMDRNLPRRELEKPPELLEIYQQVSEPRKTTLRAGDRALSIARLCDIPPFSGPARPWTTVTDDDEFVSHLVSLYLIWNHIFFNWINRDLFLRDLNSRDVNSVFCSPFLVNAILAEACLYSDYPESCAIPGDVTTKGEHFWREAKRLILQPDAVFIYLSAGDHVTP